jgi:hypothetical protein
MDRRRGKESRTKAEVGTLPGPPRQVSFCGLWLVKQVPYATSAKRLMPSMVRNALRAMRRRRKRTFNSLVFHPIGS